MRQSGVKKNLAVWDLVLGSKHGGKTDSCEILRGYSYCCQSYHGIVSVYSGTFNFITVRVKIKMEKDR